MPSQLSLSEACAGVRVRVSVGVAVAEAVIVIAHNCRIQLRHVFKLIYIGKWVIHIVLLLAISVIPFVLFVAVLCKILSDYVKVVVKGMVKVVM